MAAHRQFAEQGWCGSRADAVNDIELHCCECHHPRQANKVLQVDKVLIVVFPYADLRNEMKRGDSRDTAQCAFHDNITGGHFN